MTDDPDRDPAAPARPEAEPGPEPHADAEPEAHPWADPDRPRGLDAYFPPGGEDEAAPDRIADERRLVRLLVLMLALLVGIPLLLTLVTLVIDLAALGSR
jgi:hypothetical protein